MPGKRLVSSFILLAFIVAGCSGAETSPPQQPTQPTPPAPPTTPTNPDPPKDRFALTLVGWQSIKADQGQQITLQVRYTRNDQSLANAPISFRFVGDAKDSRLSTLTATTDANGFAETVLFAGQLVGSYKVSATAPKAIDATWDITVNEKPVEPPKPLVFAGTFGMVSRFNIQGSFTGSKLGAALNLLHDISDDPQDPGKWIVDKIFDKASQNNKTVQTMAMILKPALYVEINKLMGSIAGSLITDIKQIAFDLASLTRRFEIGSEISTPTPQDIKQRIISVRHVLKRISWELSGRRVDYTFQQLGMVEPVNDTVNMTYSNSTDVAIGQHSFTLKFGSFVLAALNNLVIPHIQKGARSIGDVLKAHIKCPSVGATINKTLSISAAFWTSMCDGALTTLSSFVEAKIADIDKDPSKITLTGQAKLLDKNNDSYVDFFDLGLWSGSLELSKSTAVIAGQANTFQGQRR